MCRQLVWCCPALGGGRLGRRWRGVSTVQEGFGANGYASGGDANADDTKPFNPKHITYEVTAPSGGTVNVNYLDQDGQPHLVEHAPLPWSYTIVTTLPSMSANIVAQGDKGMQHIRCRVIVDGQVRDDERRYDCSGKRRTRRCRVS